MTLVWDSTYKSKVTSTYILREIVGPESTSPDGTNSGEGIFYLSYVGKGEK